MLLTSQLTLKPVLCLQCDDQRALLPCPLGLTWYSSDDENVPPSFPEPQQVSHDAHASAYSSASWASLA